MGSHSRKNLFSEKIDDWLIGFKDGADFLLLFFKETLSGNFEFKEFVNQCYRIGNSSLTLISLTGFVTGFVFTKQSRPSLESFGATSWLPSLVTIAIIRALAPLVTSLICAGKVGSSIGAELGSMKVTEQVDAMEVSAVNPIKFLVVTRVLATTITIPILSFYCALMAMIGVFLNVTTNEDTSLPAFLEQAFNSIIFLDMWTAVIKAVAYGFTIGIVGCYKGYNASNGTLGVGKAANSSVVLSMFLIFIEEVFIVQVTNWFR
ncbi:ABC transporter permease [Emticicia sp. BO119]|nr:ABC transporter permease [Emticicia sp. BO119]MBA4851050.1 ABC transporter permease [Emticicia sp. BO119]